MNIAWFLMIGNILLLILNAISVYLLVNFLFNKPTYKYVDYVDENGRVVHFLERHLDLKNRDSK